jgi:hypothetical protein
MWPDARGFFGMVAVEMYKLSLFCLCVHEENIKNRLAAVRKLFIWGHQIWWVNQEERQMTKEG